MTVSVSDQGRSIYETRKVSDRGRVVIQAKARKDFSINPGDPQFAVAGKNRRAITLVKTDAVREFTSKPTKGLEQTVDE